MNALLFEGSNLEEVLNEARLCFGADVEIDAANRIRRGGFLGFFASEWFEVWARPSSAVAANPALALLDDEDEADTFQSMVRNAMADRRLRGGDGVQPALQEYDAALDDFFGGGPSSTRELVGAGAPAVAARDVSAAEHAALAAAMIPVTVTAPRSAPHDLSSFVPAGAPVAPATTPAAVALEDAPRGTSVFEEQRAPRSDLLWALLDRLDGVPAAPALPDAGVVVFAGDAANALGAAQMMGERLARWNGDVAVVSRSEDIEGIPSWLLVDDLDDLANRADRWRQRGVVPIVLDLGTEVVDQVWAIRALTALRADQVRLVTEAWRLVEDVGRTAGKLGGVDAIELVAVADTVEPLAMLDLGIPISTVEGRPTTPELLAALWLENRRRG